MAPLLMRKSKNETSRKYLRLDAIRYRGNEREDPPGRIFVHRYKKKIITSESQGSELGSESKIT